MTSKPGSARVLPGMMVSIVTPAARFSRPLSGL